MNRIARFPVAPLALILALAALHLPAVARAADPRFPSPNVQPWVPPSFDSLQTWAEDARVLFRAQRADSIDTVSVLPYNRVASIMVKWLKLLGRYHMNQAKAVEAAVDSLGFDTELVVDDKLPEFALGIIHNPFRATAHPMAFMFWFRGDRLFDQGVELFGGRDPISKVWWNGHPDAPYEWAFIDRSRATNRGTHLFLFRLLPDGGFWEPMQYIGKGPNLTGAHEIQFTDVNGDGLPELVAWFEAPNDAVFEPCQSCPKRLIENIYTRRKYEGFELHDSRTVPTPYSIFTLFIRLLIDNNRDAAARLLQDPTRVTQAIGQGWGTRRAPGTWYLEMTEQEAWPRWLQFRFRGPRGTEHFIVRFIQKEGRWIIQSWDHAAFASTAKPGKTP